MEVDGDIVVCLSCRVFGAPDSDIEAEAGFGPEADAGAPGAVSGLRGGEAGIRGPDASAAQREAVADLDIKTRRAGAFVLGGGVDAPLGPRACAGVGR